MSKTEKTAPFNAGNSTEQANVSSGGQDQGNKFAGFETAVNVTTVDGVNSTWNAPVNNGQRKEFADGKDYNKS